MARIIERFKNSWNAFFGRDPAKMYDQNLGPSYYYPPYTYTVNGVNLKSMVATIFNRISVDVSMVDIKHVKLDEDGKFKEVIKDSDLNHILSESANIDQTGRKFIEDIAMSMFDEGFVAACPIDFSTDPDDTESFKIFSVRIGKILQWYPEYVLVEAYNERKGIKEKLLLEKRITPIFENPFYTIMNEPNGKVKRLQRILSRLDRTNDINSAGKIDMIIQLPYPLKTEQKQKQAEIRRKSLENQLSHSQHGIGYIDASEKVIQLNRSVENNLWEQAVNLTQEIMDEMGLTKSIFDGTANDEEMLNYHNRTIAPVLATITEEMRRKWISRTARSQGQTIKYFNDPFKLIPVSQMAEIADKFIRNCIVTSNEFRGFIGLKPVDDEKADQLINHNLNQPVEEEEKEEIKETEQKSKSTKNEIDITKYLK